MSELRDEKKEEDPREDSKRVLGEEEFEINIEKERRMAETGASWREQAHYHHV